MTTDHRRTLADWIARRKSGSASIVIGINGAQGSGKSTLAQALRAELEAVHELRTVILSLDDLYKTSAERRRLAAEVHPLLATRGVPGTHDVTLGLRLLNQLRQLAPGKALAIPRFVKVADDRAPASEWPSVVGPVDVILFEGWCVGTPPQTEAELQSPVNALESVEDADGQWRHYVNARLAEDYAPLFGKLDGLVFLQVPDFDAIHRWRMQQEAENAQQGGVLRGSPMDAASLRRFIQHYERLTRHALQVLPGCADAVLQLGPDHEVLQLSWRHEA